MIEKPTGYFFDEEHLIKLISHVYTLGYLANKNNQLPQNSIEFARDFIKYIELISEKKEDE